MGWSSDHIVIRHRIRTQSEERNCICLKAPYRPFFLDLHKIEGISLLYNCQQQILLWDKYFFFQNIHWWRKWRQRPWIKNSNLGNGCLLKKISRHVSSWDGKGKKLYFSFRREFVGSRQRLIIFSSHLLNDENMLLKDELVFNKRERIEEEV